MAHAIVGARHGVPLMQRRAFPAALHFLIQVAAPHTGHAMAWPYGGDDIL